MSKTTPPRKCILCGKPCWSKTCRECFTKKPSRTTKNISKWVKPKLKTCKICGTLFYGQKNSSFCSEYCRNYYYNHIKTTHRDWKRRNIKIRPLKKFGFFITNIEKKITGE